MLVLSRHVDDTIRFPDLDITIQVLHLKGKSVRVGIDAPIEISVLRGELEDDSVRGSRYKLTGETEHEVRNKLNTLNVATAYAKKLIERGEYNLAANKLHLALTEINQGEVIRVDDESSVKESNADNLSALLVEDVDNEREMLAGFLRLHCINVASVASSENAISHLESNPSPDFMMVDIGLPGMSGADLIKTVRSNPAFDEMELFTISGQTPKEANINPAKNRIAKWFQKPLKPLSLIHEIEQQVR